MEPIDQLPTAGDPRKEKINYLIPISIVLAGIIIAASIFFTGRMNVASVKNNGSQTSGVAVSDLKPVTSEDHIRGNPNAPVKIVEYSDTECPFCKSFHSTLQKAVSDYGDKVVWVYRHFPIDSIHPRAPKEAEATECAGEQGGNDMFFKYLDRIFEVTPSNNKLDPAQLSVIADYVGLDKAKFESCLSSGKYAAHVKENQQDAIATGGQGTPWTFIVAPNGKKFVISGAQTYESVKQAIDLALKEK